MPNYKLSSTARDIICNRARLLMDRRLDYAKAKFPLDTDQIQSGIMPPAQLAAVNELVATGYSQLPVARSATVLLTQAQLATLTRAVVLVAQVNRGIVVPNPGAYYSPGYADALDPRSSRVRELNKLEHLPKDLADALGLWINTVVREQRIGEFVNHTVRTQLERCKTTAEVLATWPLLATLADDDKDWRARFRQPPRSLASYKVAYPASVLPTRIAAENKLRAATEVALSAAVLLEPYKRAANVVTAVIPAWERLANDAKYNTP